MIARSPDAFSAAIDTHPFHEVVLDRATVEAARRALDEVGMLIVGEPHGVRENPDVLLALAGASGADAVAFEWSHEEMTPPWRGSFGMG